MSYSHFNRRGFLRVGVAAAAGLASGFPKWASSNSVSKVGKQPVIMRMLGKTGIRVPVISMGVMRIDNPNILKAAYSLGITHFDTAHSYQNGRNEELVGAFFKDKPRDSFFISTKIHPPKGGISSDRFMEMIDLSLRRLKMEYVDILYLHAVSDRDYMFDKRYMDALQRAREMGKARFLGISTHRNMANLIHAVVESDFYDVVLTSYNFRHANDEALQNALKRAHEAGIGIIGMKNMAGGWLDEERTKPVDAKAALKWALSNPYIHTCIPGIVSYEHLVENWSVTSDLSLTPSEMDSLQLASAETGMFCLGCDECRNQCPRGLPISDLMRAYMYNYAYSSPAIAYDTLQLLNVSDNPCVGCSQCTVHCAAGFDVQSKITNIARIQKVPRRFLV